MPFQRSLVLRRILSHAEALRILGLDDLSVFQGSNSAATNSFAQVVRAAYFRAAKQCHPDLMQQQQPGAATVASSSDPAEQFRLVTQAYELLQKTNHNVVPIVDEDEEQRYRVACQDVLGQPAEIVEESKRCPMFRQWVMGKTDAAAYWRSFLMQHGGLAPRLNPKIMLERSVDKIDRRRRKLR